MLTKPENIVTVDAEAIFKTFYYRFGLFVSDKETGFVVVRLYKTLLEINS